MVRPNHSLERRTDNQAAKTDITRELVHKEADLTHIDEKIEEIGRMYPRPEVFSLVAGRTRAKLRNMTVADSLGW